MLFPIKWDWVIEMIFYEHKTQDFIAFQTDNMIFPSHLHKQIELLVCLEGSMTVTCDFKKYVLAKNHWLVILPEREHSYLSSDHSSGILLIFKPNLVSNLSPYFKKELLEPVVKNEDAFLVECAHRLMHLQADGLDRSIVKGYLYILMGTLFHQCTFSEKSRNTDDDLTWNILNYLSEHYTNELSLATVSKYFGISPSYLSHRFHEKTGCSFNSYLNEMRVDYAKYLLKNSELPIVDICFECGFSTQRSFNRAFARFAATTPREYRLSDMG